MSDDALKEETFTEHFEPEDIELTAPKSFNEEKTWRVVAKNKKVNKSWEDLMQRYPENTTRCYQDLSTSPTLKKPRRVFPLRGQQHRGIWEYEVSSGDRVFYIPDEENKKVLVFYAGKHPKSVPTP